jgi:RNA polymerase sigma-70 factor (ECF subfamily)
MIDQTEELQPATVESFSSQETDERMMEMIQAQERRGLDLLQDRYATHLTGLGMKVLHNTADAEDLVQDVFLEIWNRAASYDPLKGRPISWIATLTRRRAIDRLRKREAYHRAEDRLVEATFDLNDGWTHVHENLTQREINGYLQKALDTLPEAQRRAVTLAYRNEMSQREIAICTGIPLGTIKTRLELGLKKLAVYLSGYEDLLWADITARPRKIESNNVQPAGEPAR